MSKMGLLNQKSATCISCLKTYSTFSGFVQIYRLQRFKNQGLHRLARNFIYARKKPRAGFCKFYRVLSKEDLTADDIDFTRDCIRL